MSLFPAYAAENSEVAKTICADNSESQQAAGSSSWLENASFVPALPSGTTTKDNKDGSRSPLPKKYTIEYSFSSKHKKNKKHKRSHRDESVMLNDYAGSSSKTRAMLQNDTYFVDKKKEPSFCGTIRLYGPTVPKFSRMPCKPLGWSPIHKKDSNKAKRRSRYFRCKFDEKCDAGTEEERPFWNHDIQEELKSITEQLNRQVSQDPRDFAAWLKLIRLQPCLLSLAPRPKCLLSAAERRTVTDKQIAILDRALESNPSSAQLLRERYGLASTVIPADELAADLRKRLDLQPMLLEGWLELARIERSHLASCSVPAVTEVYAQALVAVNARRRREPVLHVESTIMAIVLACGQFLQEAGLMEQVWTLLRLYIEPSLPPDSDPETMAEMQKSFNQNVAAWESQAATQEDELLASGLPSSEVWLRVERLRESAHFLPAPDCVWAREGDPQRLVFPEDLAHLVQPVTQRSLSLRVATTILLVLGAPPLPSHHVSMAVMSQGVTATNLGLMAASWPLFCPDLAKPVEWLGQVTTEILSGTGLLLTRGPGGRLYRQLLTITFLKLANRLEGIESRSLLVWWLRTETLLARLQPDQEASNFARKTAKRIIKKPEHRSNPFLFREFALLEATIARDPTVGEKMLISVIQASQNLGPIVSRNDRAAHLSVFVTATELLAAQGRWSSVSSLLVSAVSDVSGTATPSDVARALHTYQRIAADTIAAQDGEEEVSIQDILCEDFLTLWITAHCWLLIAVDTIWSTGSMLEQVISQLNMSTPLARSTFQRERLFSLYVCILEFHNRTHPGGATLLRKVVDRALSEFPNNSSVLAVQANMTIPIGQDTKLFQTDQLLGNIIRSIALEHRVELYEIAESNTTLKCSPRIIAQYERLTCHFESRHCPMVWRLYLRYVGLRSGPDKIKSIFYKAIEDCPWVRILYIQGAALLPEELSNIQDLLVEKELRLHAAPEELEILRR